MTGLEDFIKERESVAQQDAPKEDGILQAMMERKDCGRLRSPSSGEEFVYLVVGLLSPSAACLSLAIPIGWLIRLQKKNSYL